MEALWGLLEWLKWIASGIITTILSAIIWNKIIKPMLHIKKIFKVVVLVIAAILIFFGTADIYRRIVRSIMPKVVYFEDFEKGLGRLKKSPSVDITGEAISGKYSLRIQSKNSSFSYQGTVSDSEELFRINHNYLVSFKYRVIDSAFFKDNPADPKEEPKAGRFYLDIERLDIKETQENEYYYQCSIEWNGSSGSEGTARLSFTADVHDLRLAFGVVGKGTTLVDDVEVVEIQK